MAREALGRRRRRQGVERVDLPVSLPQRHGAQTISFSGLKTAVLTLVRKAGLEQAPDIAAAFQAAAVDVLVTKSLAACAHSGATRLVVAGGVGANAHLRERLTREAGARGITVFYPRLEFCTDNGAMIAYAGAQRLAYATPDLTFVVKPRWELSTLDAV